MKSIAKIISLDTTLRNFTLESLPHAGWDRVRSLVRSGFFDGHFSDSEHLELLATLDGLHPSAGCLATISGATPEYTVFRVFPDGSLHVITSADSEVWADGSDFVAERLRDKVLSDSEERLVDFVM